MAKDYYKIPSPVVIGSRASAPSSPENGMLYYNTTDSKFYLYENDAWIDPSDASHNHDSDYLAVALKGASSGLAELDAGGKVPQAQLPGVAINSTFVSINEAAQLALTVEEGDVCVRSDESKSYIALNADNVDMADWQVLLTPTDAVLSVNSQTGAVSLDSDDIAEGTNKFVSAAQKSKLDAIEASATADQTGAEIKAAYEAEANAFTDAQFSKLAAIEASATADQTGAEIKAAYEAEADTNAFTDAEQSKLAGIAASAIANVSEDASPSLGGDLSLGANVVIHDANGMKRGSSASDFCEEEYIHAIALSASQTAAVASELSFAHASFEGCIIDYKIKEATSGDVRVGQMFVACDGTNVSISGSMAETADVGISWSVGINVGDVEIKYTSGSNACTMRADVKRIKA